MKLGGLLKRSCYFSLAYFLAITLSYSEKLPEKNQEENSKKDVNAQIIYQINKYSLPVKESISLRKLVNERVSYNITNNLATLHFIGYLSEADSQRKIIEDIIADDIKSPIKNGIKQALRESVLEKSSIDDYIRDELGEKIKDLVSGREEKNTLVSPFDRREGVPGLEKTEPNRLTKKWEWGVRPFRTNPYGFITGKMGDSRIHLRSDIKNAEMTWQEPITKEISLTGGMRFGWDDEEGRYGFLGISGEAGKGIFSLESTINKNRYGLIAFYSKEF